MLRRCTLIACVLATGCPQKHDADKGPELPDVGIGGSSDAPPPGLDRPPARGDLRKVAELGRWLHASEHAVEIAVAHAVTPRGTFAEDLVLPLVDVDPGGQSAQVLFVRWPGAASASEPPEVAAGERWMSVSLLMAPDRVLDTQVLHGNVVPASDEGVRVAALLAAAYELRRVAPGHAFREFDRRLVPPPAKTKKEASRAFVTAVYALARAPEGPDLELVVDAPARKGLPAILQHDVVHASGAFDEADDAQGSGGAPLVLLRPEPSPLTVARALRHPDANVMVHAQDGRYEVSGRTGAIERLPTQ
ncbi:MAG TPA: hypothetical protein VFG69_06920 [Nannocystaceae bacterium]|nr:hypothetical protein [Nannocystaceae bacterium]